MLTGNEKCRPLCGLTIMTLFICPPPTELGLYDKNSPGIRNPESYVSPSDCPPMTRGGEGKSVNVPEVVKDKTSLGTL